MNRLLLRHPQRASFLCNGQAFSLVPFQPIAFEHMAGDALAESVLRTDRVRAQKLQWH